MKKIHYAIISYHRPECVTVRTLLELNIPAEDICIFLQDLEDPQKYEATWPNIKKVLFVGKGVSQNRNNVLRYDGYSVGDWVALLDDDVLSFTGMNLFFDNGEVKATSRKIYDGDVFVGLLRDSFENSEQIGAITWGCAPTDNAMFARIRLVADGSLSINKLWQGGLVGHIIDKQTFYDESYGSVEDYEFQLRIQSKGGVLIRRNDLAASKKPNRNYKGGLYNFYRENGVNRDIDKLCEQYKGLVKPKPDYSGVIQRGNSNWIKK